MFQLLTILLSFCRPSRLIPWALFFLLLAVAWLAVNYTTLQRYFAERERRNTYRETVVRLQQQQQQLQNEQAALQAGGFPAEKAIRERLMMVKPGEKILFIETPVPAGSEPKPAPKKKPDETRKPAEKKASEPEQ